MCNALMSRFMSGIVPLKSIKSGIGIRVGANTVLRF